MNAYFVFGRLRTRRDLDGRSHIHRLPPDQWQVTLPDHHPGYITWETFEANQRTLLDNAKARGPERRSPPREGPALLQGLALCGRCGRRMTVRYTQVGGQLTPHYLCQRRGIETAQPVCQHIPGAGIDQAVGRLLLETLSPVQIDVTLAVQHEVQARLAEAELQEFRAMTKKKLVVLAPTGVAAVNVGGQTIHSFFGFRPGITLDKIRARSRGQSSIYKQLDMIIIDEISMVRADLLDCIEKFLRLNGRHEGQPFGGIQMVFIGDLYQLPPVVPEDERELFETVYASSYFFDAPAYAKANVTRVELTEVYRQRDPIFVELLDALRTGTLNGPQRTYLNRQCFRQRAQTEGSPIQLVTTNHMADRINHNYLERLAGKAQLYTGEIRGTFGERQLPTHERLRLRTQAPVMLLNNDKEDRWINGDLGWVETFPDANKPDRAVTVKLDRGEQVDVLRYKWEVIRFRYNPERDRIESEVMGSFTQYPLRLAWAVTIHKAQGKTFDEVVVDFGRGTFAPGQAYVALSRCTSMDGLLLRRPLEPRHIFMDERITTFLRADPEGRTPPRLV